ncbi:MAG: YdgA family protein [Pseudomonas sp.]|uniref:YdgA family protein n=1 Tax=Pseudomonas abieticivorans TaxID=2931382 RepID=UPI0020BDB73B|nr:YdgA family protein [Pseudomonas sp. PIA16]MDE1164025.1 YdgA family protein [Pseudomonas sp.]
MSKAAKFVLAAVVVVGAVATAGAWYTGTRLEGTLQAAIAQANQQLQAQTPGPDGKAQVSLELVSLDRHLFSSEAHYRLTVQGREFGTGDAPVPLDFTDHIEHGPLPLSRLITLRWVPVMAVSNISLQNTPVSQPFFAQNNGNVPLKGQVTLQYDRSSESHMQVAPLKLDAPGRTFKVQGLSVNLSATADTEKYEMNAVIDSLAVDTQTPEGVLQSEFHKVEINSGGTRGTSGFYLGHTDVKAGTASFQVPGKPLIMLKDTTGTSLLQEVEGKLAAQVNYDLGQLQVGGKDIGTGQLAFKVDRFDIAASKRLNELYQTRVVPQQQVAMMNGEPLELHLTEQDKAQLNTALSALLDGKPHVELEKLSLKTANGESHASVAVDLANPSTQGKAAPGLGLDAVSVVDAKVLLSKAMINDIGRVQAQLQGQTDPAAIDAQAKNASDLVSGMAVTFQWGKVDGDNVVSDLHYANGVVDFNGQKMTPQQFVGLVAGRFIQQ